MDFRTAQPKGAQRQMQRSIGVPAH